MKRLWIAGLLIVAAGCVRAVRPPPPPAPPAPALPPSAPELLDALLAPIEAGGDIVSALVVDAVTGAVLYARHEHTRTLPASTLKLATTAAALATLGTEFRYHTRVAIQGSVRKHLLSGDLVVAASGDPSFGSSRFPETSNVCSQIADALAERQVTRWDGSLRLIDSGSGPGPGPGWAWNDSTYDYGAAAGTFIFHENAARLVVSRAPSDRCGDQISWVFDSPNGGLVAGLREDTDNPDGGLDCLRSRGTRTLQCVWHHSPATCPLSSSIHLSFDDPLAAFQSCVNKALRKAGINRVAPQSKRGRGRHSEVVVPLDDTPSELLVDIASPPLSALVRVTNKESLNIFAERLGLEVARTVTGTGSYSGLHTATLLDQQARGIDPTDLIQVDGSGLSRYNLATSTALVRVLFTSLQSPYGAALLDSLPIAGVDGTLAHHELSSEAAGHVRAKTGTLTGQRTFAGVIDRPTDTAHPRVVFALMFGNLARPTATTNETFDQFSAIVVTGPIR